MYRSPLKLMIKDGKRLSIRYIVVKYRYLIDGSKIKYYSSKLTVYGVDTSGSVEIGNQYMTTKRGYVANEFTSCAITGVNTSKLYNYCYITIDNDTATDSSFRLDGLKINTVVTDYEVS